jgi:hypothetical protein
MATAEIVKQGKNYEVYSDGTIMLFNVRASYPHPFYPYATDDDKAQGKTGAYSCVGLMPKESHGEAKDACVAAINDLLRKNKLDMMPAEKKFIRNGDDLGKVETKGMFQVSAREQRRPLVLLANGDVADKDEHRDLFYGGCWVNMLIRPWFQSHQKYGKRVNAGLSALQFVRDDEAFGEGRVSAEEVQSRFRRSGGSSGYSDGMGSSAPDDI